jgi:glucokinase
VKAIGVAAAGYVDASRSVVLFAPNLAWRDEPLRDDLERRTGMPVLVENDANAATWGEFRFGTARDVDDMLLLTVGTGLGGGVVLDGNLLRGAHGVATELGHVRVVPDGIRCGCGQKGCWEQYASGSALVREARTLALTGAVPGARLLELAGGDPEAITGPQVTQAAQEGDPAAQELLADLGRWLGEGASSMVAVLDPAMIVLGGGVASAGDLLVQPMRAAFRRTLPARGYRPEARIELASLGNEAGIIGAADLAAQAVSS